VVVEVVEAIKVEAEALVDCFKELFP